MNVTSIPIVIDVLGTVFNGLVQGLPDLEKKGPGETIQSTALLTSTRFFRYLLLPKRLWETIS